MFIKPDNPYSAAHFESPLHLLNQSRNQRALAKLRFIQQPQSNCLMP